MDPSQYRPLASFQAQASSRSLHCLLRYHFLLMRRFMGNIARKMREKDPLENTATQGLPHLSLLVLQDVSLGDQMDNRDVLQVLLMAPKGKKLGQAQRIESQITRYRPPRRRIIDLRRMLSCQTTVISQLRSGQQKGEQQDRRLAPSRSSWREKI